MTNEKNLHCGKAEVVFCEFKNAWVLPGGRVVHSRLQADKFGWLMHDLIMGAGA